MQVVKQDGTKDGDLWVKWLPAYEKLSETGARKVCGQAILFWQEQRAHAFRRELKVKTVDARQRWSQRYWYCNGQSNRWQNSLRDVLIKHKRILRDNIPF